jgi:hypothetical protein
LAHTCNPRYSGGRDQEAYNSKPVQANSLQDPILKITYHKRRAGGMAQGVDPESNPSTAKENSCHMDNNILLALIFFSKPISQQNISMKVDN